MYGEMFNKTPNYSGCYKIPQHCMARKLIASGEYGGTSEAKLFAKTFSVTLELNIAGSSHRLPIHCGMAREFKYDLGYSLGHARTRI